MHYVHRPEPVEAPAILPQTTTSMFREVRRSKAQKAVDFLHTLQPQAKAEAA